MPYPNWNPYYAAGAYQPPMPDQLAQLRANQYQQQMQQPTMPQYQNSMNNFQAQPQPTQPSNSRIWVSSEKEVLDYLVAPNCSADLWHTSGNVMYVKQADASGKPTIKIYDVTERTAATERVIDPLTVQNYATKDEVNRLWQEINDIRSNMDTGAIPVKAQPKKQKQTADE